jgi:putative ABC transport system substrate-binding protein
LDLGLPILDCGEKQMHEKNWMRSSRSDNPKSKICSEPRRSIQNLKWVGIVAIVTFATCGAVAQAQQPKSVPRIGYLSRDLHPSDSRAAAPRTLEAFRKGLGELGYIERKNIIVEYRYADERLERLPALAEELVGLKVEIIVADTTSTARAARKATSMIPIVFLSGSDPTQSGLAASLARPGGNVTGLTNLAGELRGKRLELLKEVVPKVTHFALLEGTGGVASRAEIPTAQAAAQAQGVRLQLVEVTTENPDFDGAFRIMVKERIGGLINGTGAFIALPLNRRKILALVEKTRMPAIYATVAYMEEGGLMYYGANAPDLFRRGATIVDKILKGAKPADLPVERPTKFELIVNLKAAKQIGVTIPPNVLARADKVIK